MAITPKHYWVSEIQVYDADSSDYIHIIADAGVPDGAADPQASAYQGSLYFRTDASDDEPCLYVKVDTDSADDDWVALLIDKDESTKTIEANWTWDTSNAILLRDAGQKIYSPAADTGALALAASGDTWQIGDQAASNYIEVDFEGEVKTVGVARFNDRARFEVFEDFTWVVFSEALIPWELAKGSDGAALDPAIVVDTECGIARLTTGAGDGSTAQDASLLVSENPVQADGGGLVFEARLRINTAITNISVCVGLTDTKTLEEPFTNAADVITSNATDAVAWLYDTGATTDEWWMCAVDSDADDTGNAASGTAPTADIFQVFRIEVASDGNTVKYYIDGALEGTLTNAGVSPDVNLYMVVVACGDGTLSKTADVDYMYAGHTR